MLTDDIQMRFKDIDMFGHVNNTVYLEYMDYGKTRYINQVLDGLFDVRSDAMVIVNINCNFMHPTLYDEPLQVRTEVTAIGEHTVTFRQQVVNPDRDEVKCEATVVMVGFNARKMETIVIPDSWRAAISAHEGRQL